MSSSCASLRCGSVISFQGTPLRGNMLVGMKFQRTFSSASIANVACWRCSGVSASSHLLAAAVIAVAARLEVDRCELSVTPAPQTASSAAATARRGMC